MTQRRIPDRRKTVGRRIVRERRRESVPVVVERRSGKNRRGSLQRRSGEQRRVSGERRRITLPRMPLF
ncbi:MAG TPA: hypothetical protein VJN39_06435 [Gemmatimonadales bacterium]|nr:hypothetical protein [Gemmatimonadales bacterium]